MPFTAGRYNIDDISYRLLFRLFSQLAGSMGLTGRGSEEWDFTSSHLNSRALNKLQSNIGATFPISKISSNYCLNENTEMSTPLTKRGQGDFDNLLKSL